MKKITHTKNGFALLFAVLVSSLIISIGATIISISIRQTLLSNTARESQLAFYTANTGLECAFFWDNARFTDERARVFPVGADNREIFVTGADANTVDCSGDNLINPNENNFDSWTRTGISDNTTTTFRIKLTDQATSGMSGVSVPERCVEVKVTKSLATTGPLTQRGIVTTTIESKGYNTCDLDSSRAVERGIEITYQN